MLSSNLNFLAIIVAGLASMPLGMLWYSPMMFGKQWMKARGMENMTTAQMQKGVEKLYALSTVAAILSSFVLAVFISVIRPTTVIGGVQIAVMIWLGFVMTVQFTNWLFSGKPKQLFLIDTGYQFVTYLVMGIILSLWR